MGAKKGNLEPKPTEILEKLEPKRLLSYYRAEQQRFRRFRSIVECECCGAMHWGFKSMSESDALKQEQNKQKYTEWGLYLEKIKGILSNKKHVSKR